MIRRLSHHLEFSVGPWTRRLRVHSFKDGPPLSLPPSRPLPVDISAPRPLCRGFGGIWVPPDFQLLFSFSAAIPTGRVFSMVVPRGGFGVQCNRVNRSLLGRNPPEVSPLESLQEVLQPPEYLYLSAATFLGLFFGRLTRKSKVPANV